MKNPRRSADELVSLFAELGLVGRRALRRGESTTLDRFVKRSAANEEAMRQVLVSLEAGAFKNIQPKDYDDLDDVKFAVSDIKDDWAMESIFGWFDYQETLGWSAKFGALPFSVFLNALITNGMEQGGPDALDLIFVFSRQTASAVIGADENGKLAHFTTQEVLVGYSRMCSLAEMLRTGEVPDDRYTDAERALYFNSSQSGERMREWLFYDLAAYEDDLRARYDRAEIVAQLLILHPVPAHVAAYLRTVYRTFIQGFMPETVVMCRALLERSTARAFCLLTGSEAASDNASLASQITALREGGWLSPDLYRDATDVRLRGNKAVHGDPSVVKDSLGTVQAVLRVVSALEREALRNSGG